MGKLTAGQFSVRQRQLDAATVMLNLNSNDWQPNWKFLIDDTQGRDILGPLFSIDKLKNHYVTQHLQIDSNDREPVPYVAAVYFVCPTDKNVKSICRDISNHLYDSYYLNFITPITRSKLKLLADTAISADSVGSIEAIYDQYLNFISLEDDFFVLREHNKHELNFQAFYRLDATDDDINRSLDCIVEGLLSVCITLTVIPVIRCPKGGPASVIASKLDKRIRDILRDDGNTLYNSRILGSRRRPLLCIVDRIIDMSTPLHHALTYQALIHDTLNVQLNRVEIVDEEAAAAEVNPLEVLASAATGEPETKTNNSKSMKYDLDPSEQFWIEQRGQPFPQVAEAIQRSLEEYKKREKEMTSLSASMSAGLTEPSQLAAGLMMSQQEMMMSDQATKLQDAALTLPELSKSKAILKKHTDVATAVLDKIKARKLDLFFEIEEKIMNRSPIDRVQLDEMLAEDEYGLPEDKYRLFLICCICDNPKLTD